MCLVGIEVEIDLRGYEIGTNEVASVSGVMSKVCGVGRDWVTKSCGQIR